MPLYFMGIYQRRNPDPFLAVKKRRLVSVLGTVGPRGAEGTRQEVIIGRISLGDKHSYQSSEEYLERAGRAMGGSEPMDLFSCNLA